VAASPPSGSTQWRIAACALALACGCDDAPSPSPSPADASASAPAHRGIPGLDVTIDDRALPVRSLLAYSRGGIALQLVLSTHPIGCGQLDPRGTLELPGELVFDLTLAPLLGVDGKSEWAVVRARYGGVTREGKLGTAVVSAFDPREQVEARLEASVKVPAAPAVGVKRAHSLLLSGRIEAEGCGLRPYRSDAKVRPQKDLSLEIAGKAVAVHGASLRRRNEGVELLLTSEPHGCSAGALGADVAVTLQIDGEQVKRLGIGGYRLPARSGPPNGALGARLASPLDGAEVVGVEVAGVTEVGGYRVTLDGPVDAIVCDRAGARTGERAGDRAGEGAGDRTGD
jgi:hypothetical protein